MPSASVNSPSIVPPARIGFVGLGKMGHPMARNLARAGYGVIAHDVDRDASGCARDGTGVEAPRTLKATAERCEAVITMLPDGNAVRAVVFGSGGTGDCLVAGLSRGSVLIDMSSSSPLGTRELGARLAERGGAMLDAAVAGGGGEARDGTPPVMGGGEAARIGPCPPVLG